MPDNNNRYVKADLKNALLPAELNIAQYKPPAAGADPPAENPGVNFHVDISEVQRQFAEKSAEERTNALFDILMQFIVQGCSDEIARQQILQRLTNLETRLTAFETRTVPSGSI